MIGHCGGTAGSLCLEVIANKNERNGFCLVFLQFIQLRAI